jgi:hypothetical protein
MDYGNLCKDILALDQNVRFAGVSDDTGEIKYGGQRQGISNLQRRQKDQIYRLWLGGACVTPLLLKLAREGMLWQNTKGSNV